MPTVACSSHRAARGPRRRIAAATTAVLLAAGLSACGSSHTALKFADMSVNGSYVQLGPMNYQVQISREINPWDVEDRNYLLGLPSGTTLQPFSAWFGVFIRVENPSKDISRSPSLSGFYLTDTLGHIYRPIALNTHANQYAYQPTNVIGGGAPRGGVIPNPDTAAGTGPIGGAELLFQIPLTAYDNRPIELHIVDPNQSSDTAVVSLDV
jgi:hypothetical protein